MEYHPHGDLNKHLTRRLPEDETRIIAGQLLEGLNFMHRNSFAHRDLKPHNIMVVTPGPDWLVQISDFGISRRFEGDGTVTLKQGTMGFIAPELLGLSPPGSSPYVSDIFSLGAVLFFTLTNSIFAKDVHRLRDFANGNFTAVEPETKLLRGLGLSTLCCRFVCGLLAPAPEDRISSQEALKHSWIGQLGVVDDTREYLPYRPPVREA